MAPFKSPAPPNKSERLAELGKLIESALERHGVSARAIAHRAGIGASHLSKVLKAQRSLRRAKLIVLADLLGLNRDKVLRLAGFGLLEKSRVDLGRVTLLRTLDRFTLNVVVTPRFYDAAVFMWILSQQPLAEVGVDCQLRRVDWASVPAEIASYSYSVGFHDLTTGLFRIGRWSHLCLDKGHALIARGASAGKGKEALSNLAYHAKERGERLRVISFDRSRVDFLRDSAGVAEDWDVQIISNPDVALESFQAGAGDLFLGGLPQRLALRKGPYHEIIAQGKEFPRLFTVPSLVCSEPMLAEKRPVLHGIEALWYDTCRRLYAELEFRKQAFQEICDLLERYGIEKHNFAKEDFEALFSEAGRAFEIFAHSPSTLLDEMSRSLGF
jgi:transcriptional regulator with XRE-family HTH domain